MDIYEKFFLLFVLVIISGVFVGALIINIAERFIAYRKRRKAAQAKVDKYLSNRTDSTSYDYFGLGD